VQKTSQAAASMAARFCCFVSFLFSEARYFREREVFITPNRPVETQLSEGIPSGHSAADAKSIRLASKRASLSSRSSLDDIAHALSDQEPTSRCSYCNPYFFRFDGCTLASERSPP